MLALARNQVVAYLLPALLLILEVEQPAHEQGVAEEKLHFEEANAARFIAEYRHRGNDMQLHPKAQGRVKALEEERVLILQ